MSLEVLQSTVGTSFDCEMKMKRKALRGFAYHCMTVLNIRTQEHGLIACDQ